MKKIQTLMLSLALAASAVNGLAVTVDATNGKTIPMTSSATFAAPPSVTITSKTTGKRALIIADKTARATYAAWYKAGGSHYFNHKTKKKALSSIPSKFDYVSAITLIKRDFIAKKGYTPDYVGIQSSELSKVSDWVRAIYPDSKVGNLDGIMVGMPGLDNEIPLIDKNAIHVKPEYAYKVKGNYYVVSALAYYGEFMRTGYDIGIEMKKDGSMYVHFVTIMWEA